jgi:hypothetical protein
LAHCVEFSHLQTDEHGTKNNEKRNCDNDKEKKDGRDHDVNIGRDIGTDIDGNINRDINVDISKDIGGRLLRIERITSVPNEEVEVVVAKRKSQIAKNEGLRESHYEGKEANGRVSLSRPNNTVQV